MEERLLLAYAVNLEIRDRLEDITSPSNWIMSESLKVFEFNLGTIFNPC
jgi:hypothetical protein